MYNYITSLRSALFCSIMFCSALFCSAPDSEIETMRFSGRFRLRRRVKTLFRRFRLRPRRSLLSWFQRASFAVRRALGSARPGSGYVRVRQDSEPQSAVPKGYLAVYVGSRSNEVNGEYERVLVPVIQFNHPLFGELLKETEAEFGYEHPGGITIPCRVSEFEDVRMRIAGAESCGQYGGRQRMMTWRKVKRL